MLKRYWEKDDFIDPFTPLDEPPTFRAGLLQDVSRNNFLAFEEDWESSIYCVDEKTESAARYKLLSKLKGIFLLDSDPVNEYRVVVDLEWSTSKIKA